MKTVKIPFDLELAKAGHPVCTRDGRAVRILCYDFISPENNPIIALVKLNEKQEGAIFYGLNGKGSICDLDLMMTPQKKEGWVNVFINYTRLDGYPLQEWCKSPYINEPDVGEEILETIRKKRGEWVILVRIDQYVKIDDNLLNNIAKLLVNRMDQSSNVGDFFARNLTKLSDEVQELLFPLVTTDDNTYKTFNFRKLSPTSKVKYLDTLSMHEAFDVARRHMKPEEAVEYIIKRHEQEKS